MDKSTWFRIASGLGVIGLGVMMALRSEVSDVAARSVMAAVAFMFGAIALVLIGKARW